jgi:hypothetical protein
MMAASEAEVVIFTAQGVGRFTPSGGLKWCGSHFYRTSLTGKLAFLNNVIGLFEAEIGADGNSAKKVWEWK